MLESWLPTLIVAETGDSWSWYTLAVGVLGGLALFLFGMEIMTAALKAVAGSGMRSLLARMTRNPWVGAGTGAFTTATLQSSSVTTVLAVGFVSSGLMTLQQSVGVIMGANVGTTLTAQLIAFKVTHAAMLLVAVGFFVWLVGRIQRVKQIGHVLLGLGLLFLGLTMMGQATAPLRDYQPFLRMMEHAQNPFVAIAVAAAFTAIVQSSSATTGIIVAMASQGLVSLDTGIALILGANIGTCVTAALSAIGKGRAAWQVAVVHVSFNLFGALLWVGFVGELRDMAAWISPAGEGASPVARQIANAHTIFNVANTLLLLPFAGLITKGLEALWPKAVDAHASVSCLDKSCLDTPPLAISCLQKESHLLRQWVREALKGLHTPGGVTDDLLRRTSSDAVAFTCAYEHMLRYSQQLMMRPLSESESLEQSHVLHFADYLQNSHETLRHRLLPLLLSWQGREHVSSQTREMMDELKLFVKTSLDDAMRAFLSQDIALAQQVRGRKEEMKAQVTALKQRIQQRLAEEDPERLELYQEEIQLIELLHRLYFFASHICKSMDSRVLV